MDRPASNQSQHPTRRAFIRDGSLTLLAGTTALADQPSQPFAAKPAARIGLVTDLHHADKPARGTRHYRATLGKLEEAGGAFMRAAAECVIELGDFIDSAPTLAEEKKHLRTVQTHFARLPGDKHHVLGNHCVHLLTKEEFLGEIEKPRSYYSFDYADWHLVILDACFRSDGVAYQRKNFEWTDPNIPTQELEWLQADLAASTKPAMVFAHQRLDAANHYAVKNAPAVRTILEQSGRVRAVFQGHSHKNDYREINGIHYTTLVAMVEGSSEADNGYSVLEIHQDQSLKLSGFRKQANRDFA